MSEKSEINNQDNVNGYQELSGGLTLLVWTIAFSIILNGLVQSDSFNSFGYASIGGIIIIIFTPFGAILFATGFAKILKNTRS